MTIKNLSLICAAFDLSIIPLPIVDDGVERASADASCTRGHQAELACNDSTFVQSSLRARHGFPQGGIVRIH